MRMDMLWGTERESLTPSRTQVYQATHNGNDYLPFMNRSFISFSYGGKNIEDFNLLASINGDRLQRDAYSSFDDLTTVYDTIQGQFYWGSYYRVNTLNFDLVTDGITQVELDDFKHWFQPGPGKELILSEHPNRAIIARVSAPPQLNLLPFEKKTQLTIGDRTYPTSTTLYKGEINLTFTMDEPFWYAKQNILGNQDVLQGYYSEEWVDANGKTVQVRNTPDALKIIYEDHIPLGSTTNVSVFLGGNVFATVVYKINAKVVEAITQENYTEGIASEDPDTANAYFNNGNSTLSNGEYYFPKTPTQDSPTEYNQYYKGAVIATVENDVYVSGGKIGGAELSDMTDNDSGLFLANGETANLYYAGTAPSPLKIKFQLTPVFSSNNYAIISPYNKYGGTEKEYNTIVFKATKEHHFDFTLPALYRNYNEILSIFDEYVEYQGAWLTVREQIRNNIKHPIVRAWANCVINRYDTREYNGQIQYHDGLIDSLKQGMQYLFYDASGNVLPARFEFDGKTGKTKGTFLVRNPQNVSNESEISSWNELAAGTENLINLVEDVGDMVKSSYLILDERNVLDDSFLIQNRTESHPDYAYEISHNVATGLEHLQFEFKNLYL